VKRFLVALVSVLIGAGVVAGVAVFAHATSGEPPLLVATPTGTVDTPDGPVNSASLDLAVYPNNSDEVPGPMEGVNALYASQGWPFFWPSTTLQVPANSLVTVTIKQYDSGGRVFNPFWAKAHGKEGTPLAQLAADPVVLAEVQAGIDVVNQQFAQVEQIKKFVLLGDEWMPDSDLLTPTSKLKRRGIHARFADEIESMYAGLD
jgi:hypothetical protein